MLPAIQGRLPDEVAAQLELEPGEVRRVLAGIHQRGEDRLDVVSPRISRRTAERLGLTHRVGQLEVARTAESKLDPFAKFVCRGHDGELFECVRIPLENRARYSVCVSSQVGCRLGCKFCKTAQLGWKRNLEAWEIVEQVRIVRRTLPPGTRVTGVVFQGMGEPLANVDQVIQAVRILSEPSCQAVDQKSITICTAGISHAIRRITRARLRVRLGLSLGSARPELRRLLMPIEARCPLRESIAALVEHTKQTQQTPMLAYTLIHDVNTYPEDARALHELARDFGRLSGRMPRLSLVPYNSRGPDDPFSRATDAEAETFRLALVGGGFPVVRRYSGGADIDAACGQLAANTSPDRPESAWC